MSGCAASDFVDPPVAELPAIGRDKGSAGSKACTNAPRISSARRSVLYVQRRLTLPAPWRMTPLSTSCSKSVCASLTNMVQASRLHKHGVVRTAKHDKCQGVPACVHSVLRDFVSTSRVCLPFNLKEFEDLGLHLKNLGLLLQRYQETCLQAIISQLARIVLSGRTVLSFAADVGLSRTDTQSRRNCNGSNLGPAAPKTRRLTFKTSGCCFCSSARSLILQYLFISSTCRWDQNASDQCRHICMGTHSRSKHRAT